MATFLEWNGYTLIATEEAVVLLMIGIADGSVSEDALATWLRDNSMKLSAATSPSCTGTVPVPYCMKRNAPLA